MFADNLRKSVLQAAVQGLLTEQLPTDGNSRDLLKKIRAEKSKLVKAKKIKPFTLPSISDDELPFQIPANWCWTRLGDVIELLSGRDLETTDYNSIGKGIPYITGASNFIGEKILINRWTETPKCIAKLGDLLITCKGSIGTMSILEIEKAHIARQIMSVHQNSLISIRYIKFFLQANLFHLKNKSKGIIPGIERTALLHLKFPLPPLAEQERIVARLDELLPFCEI